MLVQQVHLHSVLEMVLEPRCIDAALGLGPALEAALDHGVVRDAAKLELLTMFHCRWSTLAYLPVCNQFPALVQLGQACKNRQPLHARFSIARMAKGAMGVISFEFRAYKVYTGSRWRDKSRRRLPFGFSAFCSGRSPLLLYRHDNLTLNYSSIASACRGCCVTALPSCRQSAVCAMHYDSCTAQDRSCSSTCLRPTWL